ncbi:MAG: tail fiber protein [Dehalococcoidia bacterium]
MGTPFLGEIKLISFDFAPKGWALCNGQLLPINQNQALFSLLGTTYGGDGAVNFGLPDLRDRVPIHVGNGHTQGERAGQLASTLTLSQMPAHTHFVNASSAVGNTPIPANNVVLASPLNLSYRPPDALAAMDPATVSNVGGSQPHENRQPFLTLNFCIALQGIFPSRN